MRDKWTREWSRLAEPVLALPRPVKRGVVLVLDVVLCVLSVLVALYLRLGVGSLPQVWGSLWWPAMASVVLALPIFITSGLYRAIFRYSSWPAMVAVVRAWAVYALAFAVVVTWVGLSGVPRTVGIIQPLVLLVMVVASRVAARVWLGGLYRQRWRKGLVPQALIYGAGSAGRQLASAMGSSPEVRVVGFLDDDRHLQGRVLNGLPIHPPADLARLLQKTPITDVLLALPSVSRQRRNEILNALKPHKVAVRTLPGLSDLATGKVNLSDVRELDIDDLLGRESVQPNERLLKLNTFEQTVLVTGAGGSIGSELCRQILKAQPKRLLLVERSEYALYQIHQELQAQAALADMDLVPLLASACDEQRMHDILDAWKPHTIYHAAAYKHVPLVEHNAVEGVRNNVWCTWVCAEAAVRHGVRHFVLISTDKAVRPTNIMGATKRLAEMVLQALAERGGATTFSMVRFGNVLGSSGSVVPLFREQIKNGGPITLTHPEITRYFMTIPEAAQLVIQAGAMGQGGDVFVLDMGQPVKIIDLARRMVALSGLTVRDEGQPDGDIELSVTGLRPGEKLYEELLIGDNPQPTEHPLIMKAHESFLGWPELQTQLHELSLAMGVNDVHTVRSLLQAMVTGYQPSSEVVDWVAVRRATGSAEGLELFDSNESFNINNEPVIHQ